ncbi:MAG: iron-sulfur cluster assembly accessory protein [Pseudomonadota bacterium]
MSNDCHIHLTPSARQHIIEQLQARGRGVGIRVAVKKTGCSGLAYVMEYVDDPNDDDYVSAITDSDYAVYVDPKAYQYLKNTTVDYVKRGLNEGFEFVNPNEKNRCGCGESFTV